MIEIKKSKKIKLTDEQNKELCSMITMDYDYAKGSGTSALRNKLKKYAKQTKGLLPAEKDKNDWQSDLSLPVTKSHKGAIVSRIFEAIYDAPVIVHFHPISREDVESTEKKEKWFNNKLKNYTKNFERNLDRAVHKTTQDGTGVFYTFYEREFRTIKDIETIELSEEDVFDEITFEDKCRSIINEKYGLNVEVIPAGEYRYKVKHNRKTYIESSTKRVTDTDVVDFYPNIEEMTVDVEIEKTNIEYDGAQIKPISMDDIYFPPNAIDFQTCSFIQMRGMSNPFEIEQKYKENVYDLLEKADIELIKKIESDSETDEILIKEVVERNKGLKTDESQGYNYRTDIRIRKCFYSYDINNDGKLEEIVMTYIPRINKIANVRWLGDLFRHGERPFTFSNYDIEDEEMLTGIGLPENLEQIQEGVDNSYNLWLDYSTFISTPMGKVKIGSSTQANLEEKNIEIDPGTFIPVVDMDDLAFMQSPHNPGFALQDIALQWQYSEKVIGTSDASFGRQQYSRTPVRTTAQLISEQNIRVKPILRRFLLGYKEALKQAYKLERAYAPKEQIFRSMGLDGEPLFIHITRKELKTLPDMSFNTSIDNLNKAFARDSDLILMQQLATPMMMQMGIVQPHNLYHMAKRACLDHEVPDYYKWLTAPPNNPLEDQEVENMKMMQGEKVEVNALDNDEEHIAQLMDFFKSDNFGFVNQSRIPIFQKHLIMHKQQLQRKKMAEVAAMAQANKETQNMFPLAQLQAAQRPQLPGAITGGGGEVQ